jgi:hypothetical protein
VDHEGSLFPRDCGKARPGRAPETTRHTRVDQQTITSTMSAAMATQQFAANVLRTGVRKAGRTAPVRANRMTVRAAASNGGLPIDLRGACARPRVDHVPIARFAASP